MLIVEVPIETVEPFHEVRDRRKLKRLIQSISTNGWQGRPLLGIETADGIQALTGSHRLEAARAAGFVAVPMHLITVSEHDAELLLQGDDHRRLYALDALGFKDAAQLMMDEIMGEAV